MAARSAQNAVRLGGWGNQMKDDRGVRFRMSSDVKKALADDDSPVCVRTEQFLPKPIRLFNKVFNVAAIVVLFACVFSCFGPMFLPIEFDTVSDFPSWIVLPILVSFVVAVFGGVLMPFYLNLPNRWNRRAARELRWCMKCAYSLEGVEPQADGCTVCPECAAAWKLESPDA